MKQGINRIIKKFSWIYGLVLTALFFASVGLIGLNNYQNKVKIARSISHIIEEKLKDDQLRDVIKVLSSAQLDDFRAISYYNSQGKRTVTFPASVDPSYFRNISFVERVRFITFRVNLFFDQKNLIRSGTLKFSIDPYRSIPLATVIWAIIALIFLPVARSYRQLVVGKFEQECFATKVEATRKAQMQIRHDSRGAIQAIKAVIDASGNLDQLELDTLCFATQRLEGMMAESRIEENDFSENVVESETKALVHINTAITDILVEKSAMFELAAVKTDYVHNSESWSLFLEIDGFQFKRILSNILDNSLDAIKSNSTDNSIGKISVTVEGSEQYCKIRITDNGVGIQQEFLPNVGEIGYTLKQGGNGLGISGAKERVKEWGGKFQIDSIYGRGTVVKLFLPICKRPSWVVESISLVGIRNVIVIDDDPTVAEQWRKRLSGLSNNVPVRVLGYSSGESFFKSPVLRKDSLYFVDFDLGRYGMNGLSIAREIDMAARLYIVSNNFDDHKIQGFCESHKLKLLPKTMIDHMAFVGLSSQEGDAHTC